MNISDICERQAGHLAIIHYGAERRRVGLHRAPMRGDFDLFHTPSRNQGNIDANLLVD